MKKLTVKDFITYNNPCFSCGDNVFIRVSSVDMLSDSETVHLTPLLTKDSLDIYLKITYNSTLVLKIFLKSNKIETTDFGSLTKYLEEHRLYLRSDCNKCCSHMESQFLDFNFSKNFVHPTSISNELLIVKNNNTTYQLSSSFFDDKSLLMVDKPNQLSHYSTEYFNLPLLPLHKLKNRQRFLEKMKIYILFS
jgi:hypothetical protein